MVSLEWIVNLIPKLHVFGRWRSLAYTHKETKTIYRNIWDWTTETEKIWLEVVSVVVIYLVGAYT